MVKAALRADDDSKCGDAGRVLQIHHQEAVLPLYQGHQGLCAVVGVPHTESCDCALVQATHGAGERGQALARVGLASLAK